jgi:uncharacterized protein HemX
MPLDGLRAWIGELERKLGARTRIGLVLVALAVGAGGAGIYLALDAADNSVSKDDLQAAQEQVSGGGVPGSALESGVATAQSTAESAAAEVAKLKLQVKLLQAAVKSLAEGGSGAASSSGDESPPDDEEVESGKTSE